MTKYDGVPRPGLTGFRWATLLGVGVLAVLVGAMGLPLALLSMVPANDINANILVALAAFTGIGGSLGLMLATRRRTVLLGGVLFFLFAVIVWAPIAQELARSH